jgi:Mce-associated membrane protein
MDAAQARALADEAEAEAAEAEALAAAARAKAKAARLRRQAQEAEAAPVEAETTAADVAPSAADVTSQAVETPGDTLDGPAEATVIDTVERPIEDIDAPGLDESADGKTPGKRVNLRVPVPSWKAVALALAVVCTCALLAASGFMIWQHEKVDREAQANAEYAAAARQSVVTLMSLDYNKAQEGVQRIIDNSTGTFKADFEEQAANFAKVAKDSKVVTEVTVNSTAVKTMNDNTANVLVSATSRITNTAGAKQDPRAWRLSVDLAREGDQIKLAKVEFVP